MKRLDEIFFIQYGSQLDLNKCVICEKPNGFNFVNRSEKNCGISARILEEENKNPFPAGLITVAMGGSVLSSFVQQEPFYTGQNVKVLKPKRKMTDIVKLYYSCIFAFPQDPYIHTYITHVYIHTYITHKHTYTRDRQNHQLDHEVELKDWTHPADSELASKTKERNTEFKYSQMEARTNTVLDREPLYTHRTN